MNITEAEGSLAKTVKAWLAANSGNNVGKEVCARLGASGVVAKSFARLRPDGLRWDVLLADCVKAQEKRLSHSKIIEKASKRKKDAECAKEKLAWLRKFYNEFCIDNDLGDPHPAFAALDLLAETARHGGKDAERVLWERSRKTDDAAAISAAVGWIRQSIHLSSGAPNLEDVRIIAEAALGLDNLSLDTVNKAVNFSDAIWTGYTAAKAGGRQKSAHSVRKKMPNGQTANQ